MTDGTFDEAIRYLYTEKRLVLRLDGHKLWRFESTGMGSVGYGESKNTVAEAVVSAMEVLLEFKEEDIVSSNAIYSKKLAEARELRLFVKELRKGD